MIPKVIHYCWFGGNQMSELSQMCIQSWKRFCPSYRIVRWDENNFDVNLYQYAKEAYENGKWAFVSDVARLHVLVNYGGIYMDTDVEALRPLDSLLDYSAVLGFESDEDVSTGVMASVKAHPFMQELLDAYGETRFIQEDGSFDLTTNVERITQKCLSRGLRQNNQLQTIADMTLLPKDYLSAKDWVTRKVTITDNTLTIHHFDGSWLDGERGYERQLRQTFEKILPTGISRILSRSLSLIRYRGLFDYIKRIPAHILTR